MSKKFKGSTRISDYAIKEILGNSTSLKYVDTDSGQVIRVKDTKNDEEYFLLITEGGVVAGYLEDVK